MNRKLALPAAAILAVLASTPVMAQDGKPSGPPKAWDKFARTFGSTGLWSELGQDESYGTVQTRQAMSRSQIAAAFADDDFEGYEDSAEKLTVPVTLAFSLPDGNSAVRLKGTWTNTWADENKTYADSQGPSGLLQYLMMPSDNTLLGFGLVLGATDVDIRHNGGTIRTDARGLRFDWLQKFNEQWGLATRALYTWNDSSTSIPLGFADLDTDQENEQFYLEATLVGNFEHDHWSAIPEGWVVRPKFRALYQKTSFETVTNSLGGVNEGTVGPDDEYATLSARVRILKSAYRPGDFGPYLEVGYEREVINDLDLVVDDPDILMTKIGAVAILKNGDYLDVSYGRFDGLGGDRSVGTLNIAYTHSF